MRWLVSFVLVLFLPVTAMGAQRDYDCADFASQEEAQRYFERRGGSRTNNVDLLDADGDGIACEPYFGEPATGGRSGAPRLPIPEQRSRSSAPIRGEYGQPNLAITPSRLIETLQETPIASRDLPNGFSNARLEEESSMPKDHNGTLISWELSGPAAHQAVSYWVFPEPEEAEEFFLDHTGGLQYDLGMTGVEGTIAGFPAVAVADGTQAVDGGCVVLVGNVVAIGVIVGLEPNGIVGPDAYAIVVAESAVLHLDRIGYFV